MMPPLVDQLKGIIHMTIHARETKAHQSNKWISILIMVAVVIKVNPWVYI